MTKTPNKPAIDATIANDTLTLEFADGRVIRVCASELPQSIVAHATMHGLKQKLVDAAALSRNTETGRAASLDDKFTAVREVYNRLFAGEWNKTRGDGTGATAAGGLLYRALVRMYEGAKTPEDVAKFLDGKTDAEKAKLRANAKVAATILELKIEDARKKTDAPDAADDDGLFDGLGDAIL